MEESNKNITIHPDGSHTHEDGTTHTHSMHVPTGHGHYHSPEAKKKQLNRISKAIGHLQHVKIMMENDEDCAEVLIQLAAVRSAINSLGKEIINEHIEHCISHAIEDGNTQALDEFREAIRRFM